MNEGISSNYTNAASQREALERERESAGPERRASIDAQLVAARDHENTMRRQLDELNGFSGAPQITATPEQQQAQEQQAQRPQEPQTVSQREYTSGSRATGALGALKAERIVETHTHADIVEARIANARTAQVRDQLAGEQEKRDVEKERAAEIKTADIDRAERVFEGGHAQGELGTQDYLNIERSHRQSTVEHAQRAAEKETREAAENEALLNLAEQTGIGHVILVADTVIEGEIVAKTVVNDENYFAVEYLSDGGQTVRALVPSSGQDYALGDQVQVERKLGYHIDSTFDYGR